MSSRSAVSEARPRVRPMKRLRWWASMTATRPCHSASVHSWEITAAPLRANRPAARSEFIFPIIVSSPSSTLSVKDAWHLRRKIRPCHCSCHCYWTPAVTRRGSIHPASVTVHCLRRFTESRANPSPASTKAMAAKEETLSGTQISWRTRHFGCVDG